MGVTLAWVLAGYLIGSVSGARIIGRGLDLAAVRVVVSGTGESVPLEGVSPSALLAKAGVGAGLRATAIDLVKGVVAAGSARLITDVETAAWCALALCVGHIYPVWHRFRGGFGMTPLIGTLLVLDPIGLIVMVAAGVVLGTLVGSAFVMTELGPIFLTPWAVWQQRSATFTWFVAFATMLYLWRSRNELRVAWKAWRGDNRSWLTRVKEVTTYPAYVPGSR